MPISKTIIRPSSGRNRGAFKFENADIYALIYAPDTWLIYTSTRVHPPSPLSLSSLSPSSASFQAARSGKRFNDEEEEVEDIQRDDIFQSYTFAGGGGAVETRVAGRDTEYETYLIVNKISVMQFKAWNVADGEREGERDGSNGTERQIRGERALASSNP